MVNETVTPQDWLLQALHGLEGQKKRRISITEFAKLAGNVDQPTMSKYLSGERKPNLENSLRIAAALGINFLRISGYEEYAELLTYMREPGLAQIGSIWGELTEDDKAELIRMAESFRQSNLQKGHGQRYGEIHPTSQDMAGVDPTTEGGG